MLRKTRTWKDFMQTENIPTFQQTEKHRLAHNSQMGSLVPLIQWYKLRRIRGILTERLTLELQKLSESRARPSGSTLYIYIYLFGFSGSPIVHSCKEAQGWPAEKCSPKNRENTHRKIYIWKYDAEHTHRKICIGQYDSENTHRKIYIWKYDAENTHRKICIGQYDSEQ